MYKFAIPPDSASYNVLEGAEVIGIELDGGRPRYRRDILGAYQTLTVMWNFDQGDYDYYCSFHRHFVRNASTPFLMDLIIGEAPLTEHECYFVPGTSQLQEQRGHLYVQVVSLRAKPLNYDPELDEGLIGLVEAFEDDWIWAVDTIDTIINIDFSEYL